MYELESDKLKSDEDAKARRLRDVEYNLKLREKAIKDLERFSDPDNRKWR